jgi:tRNA threonylcarbamoyladenosine biosynthesis protein TsaE
VIALADETATLALAADCAYAMLGVIEGGSSALKLSLCGDLGAGKTCFARGFLQALGVQRAVKSPTYALLEIYPATELGEPVTQRGRESALPLAGVAHLDLYRLAEPEELDGLGLADLDQAGWVWLIEWPERGGSLLPAADLVCSLSVLESGRSAQLAAQTPLGRRWLEAASVHKVPE